MPRRKRPCIIGVDCSTTAAKAIAWTAEGRPVAEGRVALKARHRRAGWAQQDARAWWRATRNAIRACADEVGAERVEALGLTFQRESFTLLDADGKPLLPALLWYDARCAREVEEYNASFDGRRYRRLTGKPLDATAALPRMRWLARYRSELLERAAAFADVPAWLTRHLVGRAYSTPAGLDTTGLVGLRTGRYHEAVLAAAGLAPAMLPDLVPATRIAGGLTSEAARLVGLNDALPVVVAGGDGHCAALAMGGLDGATATCSLGTSVVLGVTVERPLTDPACRTLIGCTPGTFVLESVVQCGSATLDWLSRDLLGGATDPAALDRAAGRLPAGSDGLVVLPYWRGRRVPTDDPFARGAILGLTDRHRPAHLHRAILEGVACELALLLDRLERKTGTPIRRVVVGGGGARSELWCRILADVCRRPCLRPASVETASLGAAMCADIAITYRSPKTVIRKVKLRNRVFKPRARDADRYAELRRLYTELYSRNRTTLNALARWQVGSRS